MGYNVHDVLNKAVVYTIVSRLSTQLEPRSFVRTLSVGAYFRCSIPKLPAFRCNVEETD
jgi:hypothetical protein